MSGPVPAPAPSPMPHAAATPPPKTYRNFDIWNPGGHPDILMHAAQAWCTLATGLRTARADIDRTTNGLRAGWTGTASDGFQSWAGQLTHALGDAAVQCERVAQQLDEVAAKIRSTNDQVHELYVAMGVTAVIGGVFTVLSLGVSDAAAGAAMTAEGAEAASLVAILTGFLDGMLGRWVVAFAINLFATGVEKAWVNPDHNPFEGWEPSDLTHALLGADALVVAGPVSKAIPGFGAFKEAHPFLSSAAVSGSAAGTAAVADDLNALAFEGRPLGLDTLMDVGVSAGLSGAISGAAEWGAARFAGRPPNLVKVDPVLETVRPGASLEVLGIDTAEARGMERTSTRLLRPAPPEGWARSANGVLRPVAGEVRVGDRTFLVGTVKDSPGGLMDARAPLPRLGGVPSDQWETRAGGLTAPKVDPTRPIAGITVRPKPNIWHASQQLRKGTFKLVLKGLSNTALHSPSSAAPPLGAPPSGPQILPAAAPPVPAPPPPPPPQVLGGGTYTVRHGDSLWAIAHRTYGNGELWPVLYRANGGIGPDPSVIQPGQVLSIPAVARPAA